MESLDRCPICDSQNLSFGYGFAGGGLGGYTLCLDCDEILTKHRTDLGMCLDAMELQNESPG